MLDLADRLTVLVADYRTVDLPEVDGPTFFLGNPPYVRHHGIPSGWKDWFAAAASAQSFKASRLAGLHVHFFLKRCAYPPDAPTRAASPSSSPGSSNGF